MKLSPGKTMLAIHIEEPHTAQEVDKLIRELTIMRSTMEPPLSRVLDDQLGSGHAPLKQGDAPLVIATTSEGEILIWAFNSGLGWLGFGMNERTSSAVRDYMVDKLGPSDPAGLVSHDTHKLH